MIQNRLRVFVRCDFYMKTREGEAEKGMVWRRVFPEVLSVSQKNLIKVKEEITIPELRTEAFSVCLWPSLWKTVYG